MCVVALAWQAHPRWQLVLAGNRDEFHARASAAAQRWPDAPHLIGGRDLVSGGTWLGHSSLGRLAVVTNIAGEGAPDPQRRSRGVLVKDWLDGQGPEEGPEPATLDSYNPFNLLVLGQRGLFRLANRPQPVRMPLDAGLHSLSNGVVGAPWPRREQLEAAVAVWLAEGIDDPAALFEALAFDHWPAGTSAPDGAPPVFIRNPVYGTRCSTVVAIDRDGGGWLAERRFDPAGRPSGEVLVPLSWNAAGAGGGT